MRSGQFVCHSFVLSAILSVCLSVCLSVWAHDHCKRNQSISLKLGIIAPTIEKIDPVLDTDSG